MHRSGAAPLPGAPRLAVPVPSRWRQAFGLALVPRPRAAAFEGWLTAMPFVVIALLLALYVALA